MKKINPAFILSLIVGACTTENNYDIEEDTPEVYYPDSIEEYVWDEEIQQYRSIFVPANL